MEPLLNFLMQASAQDYSGHKVSNDGDWGQIFFLDKLRLVCLKKISRPLKIQYPTTVPA
jgi:hypothetical protein